MIAEEYLGSQMVYVGSGSGIPGLIGTEMLL